MEIKGKIRVGTCSFNRGKRIDPKYKNYTPIICLTKSSKYGSLGPYVLKDKKGRILENVWQFSKVYKKVPKSLQTYSRFDNTIIWDWPEEIHVDNKEELTDKYFEWRKKGMDSKYPIRYPVGIKYRQNCLYCLEENKKGDNEGGDNEGDNKGRKRSVKDEKLDYIQSRKKIYLKIYSKAVKKQEQFKELKERLIKGENLLIIEVDGPRQESIEYYKDKYNVSDNFIVDNTIKINKKNMKIMLNDIKHPFGHGYCLAMNLLDLTGLE